MHTAPFLQPNSFNPNSLTFAFIPHGRSKLALCSSRNETGRQLAIEVRYYPSCIIFEKKSFDFVILNLFIVAAPRECTTFWPLWWRVLLSIRVQAKLNRIRLFRNFWFRDVQIKFSRPFFLFSGKHQHGRLGVIILLRVRCRKRYQYLKVSES